MTDAPLSFHHLANTLLEQSAKRPFFVEIGAMDGVRFDLMYDHARTGAWDGLLVEPLPDLFQALKANYAGTTSLGFVNCAVDNFDGTLTLTRANPTLIQSGQFPPEYLGMTTSERRDAFFQNGRFSAEITDFIAKNLIDVTVPCLTLAHLLEKYRVERIDLLMVDTEGSDWRIASQLDLTRFKPRLICLEYAHFSDADKAACLAHFTTAGYANAPCIEEDLNRLFYDPALLDASISGT